VVTQSHYIDHIEHLITSLHDATKGYVIGCIEPQGLTKASILGKADDLEAEYAMAWFMANKIVVPRC